ncbi:MAG: glycerophosphodiester phosphodiesterase family protein [Sphingobium sp.]
MPDRLSFLIERPFAHRGLHGATAPENSMAAFDAAIAAGFGIECDARLSREAVALLSHDALPGGDGDAPRLTDLLDRRGDTPLLVEVKCRGAHVRPVCAAVADDLAGHASERVAIMSFNPLVLRWFAQQAPDVARGLILSRREAPASHIPIMRTLALWMARPDFLACDIRDLPSSFTTRARAGSMPVLSWTVRTPTERALAARYADQIIFEPEHRRGADG